jgi:uncharacterized protein YqeY
MLNRKTCLTSRSRQCWPAKPKNGPKPPSLYEKAGESERAAKEKAEKTLIDGYLPAQMDPAELEAIVQDEIAKAGDASIKDMGRIIGAVRARTGAGADGATIAQLVKKALEPA